jgi:hypothetical protein
MLGISLLSRITNEMVHHQAGFRSTVEEHIKNQNTEISGDICRTLDDRLLK